MGSKPWRAARIALLCVASVIGIALGAAALLVATAPGARLAAAALERLLPGLALGRVEGTLAAGLELEDLHYANPAFDVRFERVRIVPDLATLVTGRLGLDSLDVEGGRVAIPHGGESGGGPPPPPALPAAPVEVHELRLRDVDVTGAGMPFTITAVNGRVASHELAIDSLRVRTSTLEAEANGTVAWNADLNGTLGGTVTLGAEDGGEPRRLQFAGEVALVTTAEPWFARVTWSDLRVTGTPAGDVTSGAGSLRAVLGASPLRLELGADVAPGPLPDAAHLTAVATVSGADVALERLAIATLGGTVTARGKIALDTRRGMLGVDIAGLDPAKLEPRLEGRLDGRLDATLAQDAGLDAAVVGRLGGMLEGRPLDGRIRLSYAQDRLRIERADVALGDGRIAVTGRVGTDTLDLDASAHLPELADWYPPAHGMLTADAALSGRLRAPNVRLHATGERLALDGAPVTVDRLTATVDGTLPAHHAELAAATRYGRLEASVDEGWRDGKLEGRLLDVTLDLARGGRWKLAGATAFRLAGADATVERGCLDGPEHAQLCAAVARSSATVAGQRLPAALAAPWLPAGVRAQGAATLDAAVDWRDALTGTFALDAPQLVVTRQEPEAAAAPPAEDGQPARAEIDRLELAGTLDADRLQAHLSAAVPDTGGRLDGEIELAPPSTQGALRGRVALTIGDLAALDPLVAGAEGLHGSVMAELQATGTPAQPSLKGRLDAEQVAGRLRSLGITVTDGRLSANAGGLNRLDFDGRLCSDGCLSLDGTLSSAAGWQLDARVRGDGFVAADTRDYHAVVAPRLAVVADPSQVKVTGSLAVTKGRAIVDEVPRSAVRPTSDTVVHGGSVVAEPMPLPLPLVAKIATHLDHSRFEGLGIAATLDGDLDVEHTAEGRVLVQGTATVVDGTFSAYGQTLTIEQGQLIFSGAADNPALNLRATRKVEDATIGLTITGTVRDPRSEIFSDPPLSESEALARLVTGHSLASTGSADAATLERAAIGLGLKRALPTLDRLGTSLGLSELGVEAGGEANGALVAGKQLGEDVYLRYKHGLFDDFSGLELIYRITDHLRLRTETGTAHSIDLIYQVVRGLGNRSASAEAGFKEPDRGKSAAEVAAPNQ